MFQQRRDLPTQRPDDIAVLRVLTITQWVPAGKNAAGIHRQIVDHTFCIGGTQRLERRAGNVVLVVEVVPDEISVRRAERLDLIQTLNQRRNVIARGNQVLASGRCPSLRS